MPQWSRDRAADRAKYPDERWHARAPAAAVPLLLRYDHHVVRIGGRPALLLTYAWAANGVDAANADRDLPFEVSFTYAKGHPLAPAEVQAITDSLTFVPTPVTERRSGS